MEDERTGETLSGNVYVDMAKKLPSSPPLGETGGRLLLHLEVFLTTHELFYSLLSIAQPSSALVWPCLQFQQTHHTLFFLSFTLYYIFVHVCSVTSVVSDSLWPYGLHPTKLLCPWDSLGKSGLPFPSRGDLPNPRIKPVSPTLQVDSAIYVVGKPTTYLHLLNKKRHI